MNTIDRRRFLQLAAQSAGAAAALSLFPASIRRALALPASNVTGTIQDVQHVVILMQENRSFDHYFGTLRGVRGFRDRHPVPLTGDRTVWQQSDGEKEIMPFHLDTKTTSALRGPGTPHTFADAQGAWGQGRLSSWPQFKTPMSMGHYQRDDIPFQFALAEAFTICDAYHCSVTTGTDPNRIVFWSGSNFDPQQRTRGVNCTDAQAEVNNLRCVVEGTHPDPGYTYQGSALTWPTLPELLEAAGISWRIYQNPNDNWTGLMHGGLAFAGFRNAQSGTALYEKGMSNRSVAQLAQDVKSGQLPQVSWILPSRLESEHPSPSSPLQGAELTARVLEALTADPDVWSKTVFFLAFDENDGLFDHVPPPAPPSYNPDGTLAGQSTLNLAGEYFSDPEHKYRHAADPIDSAVRPWGLGPRVPFYVISPWSRGGWVNSQVFDHTSVGRFLEQRFGITVPAISPWHRTVSGDLTSTFDFEHPNEAPFPDLPAVSNPAVVIAEISLRPKPVPPATPEKLFQEPGVRRSRALPYELHVDAHARLSNNTLELTFRNTGRAGAVFHLYDRLHLERIPRRYTAEAGRALTDAWPLNLDEGRYDLWVCGPNGFVREFRGTRPLSGQSVPEIVLKYDTANVAVELTVTNGHPAETELTVQTNAYRTDGPGAVRVPRSGHTTQRWSVIAGHGWYDFTVKGEGFERRFAGRMETGEHGLSDPAV